MLDRAGDVSGSTAMARCIERHRRWHAAVTGLARNKAPAGSWTVRAIAAGLGLVVARALERLSRQRLIDRKPIDAREAEQKVLYLMAASIARTTELNPDETAAVGASVKKFKTELTDFLRAHRP
jgi:hypothetical protein